MPNILELLQNHGITPQKVSVSKGGEYHSPCPSCGGEDRFHVWPAQNDGDGSYWCRGCDSGTDCLQFLMDFDNLTFADAKRRMGIVDNEPAASIDRRRAQASRKQTWQPEHKDFPESVTSPEIWQEHAGKFVDNCHAALLENPAVMTWLAKRGITPAAVEKFKLGWHSTPNNKNSFRPRESWGLKGGKNPTTGRPQMFVLPAGVVVPWIIKGRVRRIQIRLAKKDPKFPKKKYHAVVGSCMDTFITVWHAPVYITVETVFDAIMLDAQAGDLVGAVALISSHAKPTDKAASSMRDADIIMGALDFDHAGSAASAWWPKNFKNYVRHPVPKGGDPGEAYERGVDIRSWLSLGMPASHNIASIDDVLDFSDYEDKKPAAPAPEPPAPVKQAKPRPRSEFPLHPDIMAMADMLKQCPVWIKITTTELSLNEQQNFTATKHSEIKKEISKLLFNSAAVQSYLDLHPAKAINAGNFLINRDGSQQATRRYTNAN